MFLARKMVNLNGFRRMMAYWKGVNIFYRMAGSLGLVVLSRDHGRHFFFSNRTASKKSVQPHTDLLLPKKLSAIIALSNAIKMDFDHVVSKWRPENFKAIL